MKNKQHWYAALVALLLCGVSSLCVPSARADTEPDTINLRVSQFLSKEQINGPNYTVNDRVVNQGFTNIYRVTSPFGEFDVIGDPQVAVRAQEINAIAKLREMSKVGVVAKSAGEAATTTVKTVGRVVNDPGGTLSGIPSGVGRLFKRTVRKTQDVYEKAKEAADDESQEKSNVDDGTDEKANDDADKNEAVDEGKKLAKRYLGVNSSVRKLARDLQVDPYTDNQVLRVELESMAKYAAAGSFGTKLIMPGFGSAVGHLADVGDLVYKTDPLDLRLRNEKALRDMGVSEDLVETFFENKHHTLTTLTRVIVSLEQLNGVNSRPVLVDYASQVQSPAEARFYARLGELFVALHRGRGKLVEIVATERIPFAVTEDGRALLATPVDYLRWTNAVAEAAEYIDKASGKRASKTEVWLEGSLSPVAHKKLGAFRWQVFDRAFDRLDNKR
ncbi:MAG: hypothetical protein OES09_06395 [Gammaproteobacteria bacterium]|nr:hypothetical protein [Gammaproteobacteria bacterium]